MSEEKVSVTARVRVVLDIPMGAPWSNSCQLDQIWSQARGDAIARVHRAFEGHHGVRIIGEPEVTAVFVPEKAS